MINRYNLVPSIHAKRILIQVIVGLQIVCFICGLIIHSVSKLTPYGFPPLVNESLSGHSYWIPFLLNSLKNGLAIGWFFHLPQRSFELGTLLVLNEITDVVVFSLVTFFSITLVFDFLWRDKNVSFIKVWIKRNRYLILTTFVTCTSLALAASFIQSNLIAPRVASETSGLLTAANMKLFFERRDGWSLLAPDYWQSSDTSFINGSETPGTVQIGTYEYPMEVQVRSAVSDKRPLKWSDALAETRQNMGDETIRNIELSSLSGQPALKFTIIPRESDANLTAREGYLFILNGQDENTTEYISIRAATTPDWYGVGQPLMDQIVSSFKLTKGQTSVLPASLPYS